MKRVRFRVDLSPGCSIGPGKVALLEAIRESGSLSAAARALDMSYRRAWQLLDSLNKSFREPLTAASVGGRGGGGVALTPFGTTVVEAYRGLEAGIEALASKRMGVLEAAARKGPGPEGPRPPVTAKVVGSAKGRGRPRKPR